MLQVRECLESRMEPQLYMWHGIRRRLLQRHDFYVAEVRRRVIKQFSDVEGEAERFGGLEYERLSSEPSDELNDPYDALAVIAEEATDRAEYLYDLLSDLKKQTFLGALAGLYHQWDEDLCHFVERELRHNFETLPLF